MSTHDELERLRREIESLQENARSLLLKARALEHRQRRLEGQLAEEESPESGDPLHEVLGVEEVEVTSPPDEDSAETTTPPQSPGAPRLKKPQPVSASPTPVPSPPAASEDADAPPPERTVPASEAIPPPSSPSETSPPPALREAAPAEPREPPPWDRFVAFFKPPPGMNWEIALGTFYLPRIGLIVLAVGIVLFLTLVARMLENTYGPYIRIGAGYAVSLGLLIWGRWIERRFPAFSVVLYSGGLAFSYLVSLATYYFPFARIFPRAEYALVLAGVIVAAWAIMMELRRSQALGFLVTGLGHFTVLLATIALGENAMAPVAGLALLSLGSAILLVQHGWILVATFGVAGSYLNFTVWAMSSGLSESWPDFWTNMAILSACFAVYALAELVTPPERRLRYGALPLRSIYAALNWMGFTAAGFLVLTQIPGPEGYQDNFCFSVAAALLALGAVYQYLKARDPLYSLYYLKGITLITLGLAFRFDAVTLTTWLSMEALVLLLSARRSGMIVLRLSALGVAALAVLHGLVITLQTAHVPYGAPGYISLALQCTLATVALLAAGFLHERTRWVERAPRTTILPREVNRVFWHLGLIAESPDGMESSERQILQAIPYLYCTGGLILFWIFWHEPLFPTGDRALAAAVAALVMTALAWGLRSLPFGTMSLLLVASSGLTWGAEMANDSLSTLFGALTLVALGGVALTSERRYLGERAGLELHQTKEAGVLLTLLVTVLTGALMARELTGFVEPAWLAVAALVAVGLSLVLNPLAWSLSALLLLLWAAFGWSIDTLQAGYEIHLLPWQLAAGAGLVAAIACDRILGRFHDRVETPVLRGLALACALVFLQGYARHLVDVDMSFLTAALAAWVFYGYSRWTCSRQGEIMAVVYAILQTGWLVLEAYGTGSLPLHAILGGFSLMAGFFLVLERQHALRPESDWTKGEGQPVAVAAVTALLLLMLERVPLFSDYYLTISWTMLTLVLFGLALVTRQKRYRYAGLVVLLIALLRVFFIDLRVLTGLYRVAASIVLGFVLLGIGYGYYVFQERTGNGAGEQAEEEPVEEASSEG